MVAVEISILGLATWRLTSLLVYEAGPYELLARFRRTIGVYYDERSRAQGRNEFARAFTCAWCLSVWIGAAVAGAYYLSSELTVAAALPFALSAIAVLVESIVGEE